MKSLFFLYVYNMLIISEYIDDINATKCMLSSKFDTKDLGDSDLVSGIRILKTPRVLAITRKQDYGNKSKFVAISIQKVAIGLMQRFMNRFISSRSNRPIEMVFCNGSFTIAIDRPIVTDFKPLSQFIYCNVYVSTTTVQNRCIYIIFCNCFQATATHFVILKQLLKAIVMVI